jgi:hypothetical protein
MVFEECAKIQKDGTGRIRLESVNSENSASKEEDTSQTDLDIIPIIAEKSETDVNQED